MEGIRRGQGGGKEFLGVINKEREFKNHGLNDNYYIKKIKVNGESELKRAIEEEFREEIKEYVEKTRELKKIVGQEDFYRECLRDMSLIER